jgi:phytoene desaturase
MPVRRAVVVGAGFGGLSAAILLARQGFEVTILEKGPGAGGRARVYRNNGFTFDMGPSWYLMPDVFEAFFDRIGRKVEDHYRLVRLDPSYRIYHGVGDYVDIAAGPEANLALFESIEPGAAARFREYLAAARLKYDIAIAEFLYKDYRNVFDFLNRRTLLEGRDLHVFESLDRYARRFFQSARLRSILEYSMVFLGGSPANTPALYSLMSHVDFNLGVWYPLGGMGAVVRAFLDIAESCGVNARFNCPVTKVLTESGRAVGVRTAEGDLEADVVVMNADYPHAETQLLDESSRTYPARYWRRRTLAPSAFMLYLGIEGKLPGLLHHTLSFRHDWTAHFDSIFRAPAWPEKPSIYVNCPTRTDASLAPEGHEAITVLVPVAPGLEDDDATRERYEALVLGEVEAIVGESLDGRIVSRRVFGPRDFALEFNAYRGTALGLSHTLLQSAVFRPSHRSRKVRGLYYTGQYTHPGIGVPMALISSTVVGDIIARDFRL